MNREINTIKLFIIIIFTMASLFISWYILVAVVAIIVIYYIAKALSAMKELTKETANG